MYSNTISINWFYIRFGEYLHLQNEDIDMYRYSCIYTQTANHSSYQERPKTERNPVDSVSIQNLPKRMLHKTYFTTVKHLCFMFLISNPYFALLLILWNISYSNQLKLTSIRKFVHVNNVYLFLGSEDDSNFIISQDGGQ